ncbi:S-layer homology domain-containing protein [Paenibacillus sp. GXUN7292]|uniref:S-layer homology domain-containing protein n=1 Tax=Paenibacillus sp. GXUN7292 TaxID=3422499 RepID=UPI003D7CF260
MNRLIKKKILSKVLVFFLAVAICVPSGLVYAQEQGFESSQLNTFTMTEPQGLGYPLATSGTTEFINSAYGVEEEDGKMVNVAYTSSSGDNSAGSEAPAKFVVYDLDNKKILRDFPLPGAKVIWTHGTDSKGNVYIATQSYANVFRYSPVTKELESLGAIRASDGTLQTAIYHVSFDSEDNAYFGTYPSALVVKYDIQQKKFEIIKENLFGGKYVKAHVIADDGYMYLFGSTETEAKFAKLDLESGEVEELPEFSYTGPFRNHDGIKNLTNEKIAFDKVQGLTLRGNYIFTFVEASIPNKLAMLVVYDIANNRWLTESENVLRNNGTHVPPALDDKVYVWDRGYLKLKYFDLTTGTYTEVSGFKDGDVNPGMRGSTFIQFDNQEDLPGLTLVTVQKNGTITYNSFGHLDSSGGFSGGRKFVWDNGNTYGYENVPVDAGLQPKVIRALETGPKGTDTIAIGAYMGPVLGILNHKTDEIKYIPMEQIEGMGEAHGKYYAGAYPKAEIYTVDFNTTDFSQSTKTLVTKLSGEGLDQDRPFQLIEAGEYVAISSVPDYGVLDGALTLLPVADNAQKEVYKGIIPNQSIIGLAYKDGKIYGSTAVWGGLGIDPVDENAKLFIFDLETKTVTKVVEPDLQNVSTSVMHIGGLSIGPNGDLWAISNGIIFEVDPETLEVIREFKTRDTSWSANNAWYLPYQMNWLTDTLLVTNAGEVLSAIDTQTGEMRKLTNKQTNLMAVSEDKTSIYFSSDHQYKLYKIDISFEANRKPSFLTQPQSSTVKAGEAAVFTVTASGTEPLSYQWKKNGADILGANSAELRINNVGASDAGAYSVAISNVAGSATSDEAILTVNVSEQGQGNYFVTTPTQAPTYETKIEGGQVITTIPVKTTTETNGRAVAAISETELADAIAKASEMAEKQGANTKTAIRVEVDATAEAGTVGIHLMAEALKKFIESKADALTIVTPLATMTIEQKTAEDIFRKATGAVTISATKAETAALTAEIRQKVGDRPVVSFDITDKDKAIVQLDGKATVTIPYVWKTGENPNAIIVYQINEAGKYETVTNSQYDPASGTITFKTPYVTKYAVAYNKIDFADVADHAWYYDAVTFAAARGITTGVGNGNFGSEQTVTRAQALVMLMRAFGIDADENAGNAENAENNFSDAGDSYYTGYLAAAKRLGITAGVGNNLFAPDRQITRQEMFVLTYNLLKSNHELPVGTTAKNLADFKDAGEVAGYANDAVELFIKTGIISGNNGNIMPVDSASRAQFVQILYNVLTLK